MQIRQENRNVFLLGAVTLCCVVVAGMLALLAPVFGQAPESQIAHSRPADVARTAPVRVVGAPFAPNVNPRER